MEDLLKKLEPKWLALVYGLYIVSRAIRALFDEGFAVRIVDTGYYQWEAYQLKIDYFSLTLLHPILFAIASVELAKRSYHFSLFVGVILLHLIAVEVVSVFMFTEWKHALEGAGLSDFMTMTKTNPVGVNEVQEAVKSVVLMLGSPILFFVAIYWWRRPITLFRQGVINQASGTP